ncbi:MAG: histidine--tRNA ligase, partial [Candidatus Woesearchaeota archaeon]|nr:histidine--tRNA ligase [Candidatus Woesearchaeota archaeon]
DSFRQTSAKYNYKEVSSPAFEEMGLLKKKSGEEIEQQLFVLEKKGSEEFGLRFDLTVPIVRMFIEKQKELPKPVKWFGIDRMWRYERPQSGRLREFYQLSVELFGSDRPEADAEMINLAIDCLCSLGLTKKDFVVRINNRILLQNFIESIGSKNIDAVFRAIDKKSKIPEGAFDEELKKTGLNDDQIKKIKAFLKIKDLKDINTKSEGLENLKKIFSILEPKKGFIELDLSTARGLAYYTGTVFEIFDRDGKLRSIMGGGRYDNLVELLGGEKCPGLGFAIGFATLGLLLEEKKLIPKPDIGVDYYIAPVSDKEYKKAIEITDSLRKRYSVEIDLMGRSVGKQFDYANKIKAKKVIVIGEDEIKVKKLTVKDMQTGKESKISMDSIVK